VPSASPTAAAESSNGSTIRGGLPSVHPHLTRRDLPGDRGYREAHRPLAVVL
jgi:hypothetical protein